MPARTSGTRSSRSSPSSWAVATPIPDHLRLRDTEAVQLPQRLLAAADRDLASLFFATGHQRPVFDLAGHQLVDEPAGRVAAAGDQRTCRPRSTSTGRRQGGDLPLVEVGGDDDPGAGGAQRVQLLAIRIEPAPDLRLIDLVRAKPAPV